MRNGLSIDKKWYRDDRLHRDDGPAIERDNGTREWYRYGHLHRNGGPAIEFASGARRYFNYSIQETCEKNRVRERFRIDPCLKSIQVHLPIESSSVRFPFIDLIIKYI
jgi:hypothetical protein